MRQLSPALTVTLFALLTTSGCTGDAQSESAVVTRTDGADPSVSISGDSADALGTSLVRVINATPDVGDVYVRAGSDVVAPSVPYQSVSEYARVSETWANFEASATPGDVWRRLDLNVELLLAGHRYSLIVLPGDEPFEFNTHVVRDDVPISESDAIVRLIHAGDVLEEISLRIGGREDIMFDDVERGDEAGFKEIDPTVGDVTIHSDNGSLLATVPNVTFRAGSAYTVVVSRGSNGALQMFVIEDQLIT